MRALDWLMGREARAAGVPITFNGTQNWMLGANSYVKVDGSVIANAQQSVAIGSAVDLIASICSELPIKYYTGSGPKRREIKGPAWLEDPSGDGYGIQDFVYQLIYSWAYRGNVFGDILGRTSSGMLTQASIFHPDQVSGWVSDGEIRWSVNGIDVPAERMLHRRVKPIPGQILGQSVLSQHASQIGVSLAATRFGKSFFDSDAQPVGILRNNLSGVDQEQSKTIKDRFMAVMSGGRREPIIMGRGFEWQSLSVTPEESQFLQTMGWSEAQCARMFGPGVPQLLGYETGGSLTYANIQDFDITFLKYSLDKWLKRVERVLFLFLPRPQFAEISRDALLQSSTYQRYQAYALSLANAAWKTPDEVRELENLPPLPEEEPPSKEDPAEEEPPPAEEEQPAEEEPA